MKLLIYGDIGGSGGYVRYCKGLLSSKAIPKDIEVWFISSKDFYEKLQPLDNGVHVITDSRMNSRHKLTRYLWHLWVYPRLVKQINPDIEFYPSGVVRQFLRKVRHTITTCHNLLIFDPKELREIKNTAEQQMFQKYRKIQSASFKKSDGVIFLSQHSRKVVCEEIKGLKNTIVIGHGLDPIFLLSEPRSYKLGEIINLLYVSPYYHYKHQIEVVKAVQLLRSSTNLDIRLKLIGGGSGSAAIALKNYVAAESAENYVAVNDNVNHNELIEEYLNTDIFIFASSCETFGITVLEAMGSKLPIACSDRTGLPDILKDGGIYFNPEEPTSIVKAIEALIVNEDLRRELAGKAYAYALDYTWQRTASETFDYIKKIYND